MTSIIRRTSGAIILALSLVFGVTSASQAQEQYDEAKLESFVTAALMVNDLVEQWTPRIQGAQDETEAAQLRDQANSELVAAIESADGISVEEYREISQAAQADPQLMARISGIFDEREPQSRAVRLPDGLNCRSGCRGRRRSPSRRRAPRPRCPGPRSRSDRRP